MQIEIEKFVTRQTNLQNSFLDGDITSSDYNEMKSRIESELSDKQVKLERLKSTKSPFKVYLNKTLPMIENLRHKHVPKGCGVCGRDRERANSRRGERGEMVLTHYLFSRV
mgnify:CR=1 FL=1